MEVYATDQAGKELSTCNTPNILVVVVVCSMKGIARTRIEKIKEKHVTS